MSSRVIPMAAAAVRYGTSDMAFEWEPQPEHVTVKRSKMLEGFGSNLGHVLGFMDISSQVVTSASTTGTCYSISLVFIWLGPWISYGIFMN